MTLEFHYAPYSTSTVTHAVLEGLGVPVTKHRVTLGSGTATPAFRRLNPNGLVPVLVHDGQPIFESAAITIYLGETFGVERGLFPGPGPQRGVAMQWIVWTNVTLVEAVNRHLIAGGARSPAERHNAAVATWGKADLQARLGILDAALADRPYLLGEGYALVDTHLASTVGWINQIGLMPEGLPNLGAWLGRCAARPAFARAMAAEAA